MSILEKQEGSTSAYKTRSSVDYLLIADLRAKLREAQTFDKCWEVFRSCTGKDFGYKKVSEESLKKASLNAITTRQFINIYLNTSDEKLRSMCLRGSRRFAVTKKDILATLLIAEEFSDLKEIERCKEKLTRIIKREIIRFRKELRFKGSVT